MIEKETIKQDLENVKRKLERLPTKNDYDEFGVFCSHTVKRHYGSWSKAILEVFNEDVSIRRKDNRNCLQCSFLTSNSKFCSRKCSASYNSSSQNGRKTGRKAVEKSCVYCKKPFVKIRSIFCEECKMRDDLIKTKKQWLSIHEARKIDLMTDSIQPYDRIRHHARKIASKAGLLSKCLLCDYCLHVECAHRQSIESFPNDAFISEINSPKNLAGLCCNHHWEYDHKMIKLTQ